MTGQNWLRVTLDCGAKTASGNSFSVAAEPVDFYGDLLNQNIKNKKTYRDASTKLKNEYT